jgi:hypothetical protein
LLTKPGGRVNDIKGGGKDATPRANNALLDIDSVRVSSDRVFTFLCTASEIFFALSPNRSSL